MKKIVIILLFLPQLIFAQNILQSLKFELEKGELTYEDYLVYTALAIYEPEKLPAAYSNFITEIPLKSGTLLISEIKFNWDKLSSKSRSLLKPYLQRPELSHSIVSPSRKFRIHYTKNGINAVSPQDDDQNGIPDYVDQAAEIFDYCHRFEIDSLGYKAPPADRGVDGDEYDVYIKELYLKMYGQTVPEDKASDNPETHISYLEIDNDYKGFNSSGLDGLRVTAAHEYFHAIQMGYKYNYENKFWNNEVFFYEVSSTWMEDVVYDDINDYYLYMKSFFRNINKPFTTYDYSYEYGNCLWNHMLTKKYNRDIIKEIWEELVDYPVCKAMDRVLQRIGSSFFNELSDYSIWNYFTGSRQDSINYYPEGINYPEVTFTQDLNFISDTTVTGSSHQLAFSFYNFYDTDYRNNITLIPINIEPNSNLNPEFKLQLSRSSGSRFKEIAYKFFVHFTVDNPSAWNIRAIITDAYGNIFIDNMSEEPVIGFGPNPFIVSKHRSFNLYYKLKEESSVKITIFSENGYKIKQFSYPSKQRGPHKFSWEQTESGAFPGGSGVYILLFQTNYSKKIIKFAVIQ